MDEKIYEPRHAKMCLRDKSGHFEIFRQVNSFLFDQNIPIIRKDIGI